MNKDLVKYYGVIVFH